MLRCRGGSCASVYAWRCNYNQRVSLASVQNRIAAVLLVAKRPLGRRYGERARSRGPRGLGALFVRGGRAYRMVLPVRRRIHWGIGRFCFWALASFCLVRNDLWLCKGGKRRLVSLWFLAGIPVASALSAPACLPLSGCSRPSSRPSFVRTARCCSFGRRRRAMRFVHAPGRQGVGRQLRTGILTAVASAMSRWVGGLLRFMGGGVVSQRTGCGRLAFAGRRILRRKGCAALPKISRRGHV